jgi:hypothetical protein
LNIIDVRVVILGGLTAIEFWLVAKLFHFAGYLTELSAISRKQVYEEINKLDKEILEKYARTGIDLKSKKTDYFVKLDHITYIKLCRKWFYKIILLDLLEVSHLKKFFLGIVILFFISKLIWWVIYWIN